MRKRRLRRLTLLGLTAFTTLLILSGCGKNAMNGTYYALESDTGYSEMVIKLKNNGEQNKLSEDDKEKRSADTEAKYTNNTGGVEPGYTPRLSFRKNKEGKVGYSHSIGTYDFDKKEKTVTIEIPNTHIVYYEESSDRGKILKQQYNELK